MTDISPLYWPRVCKEPTWIQRFLRGIPILGIDSVARRHICAQLALRDRSCLQLWPDNSELITTISFVFSKIQEWFRWPNDFYMPEDPCEILFWDSSLELRVEGALLELASRLHIPIDLLAEWMNGSLGDFVNRILDFRRETGIN